MNDLVGDRVGRTPWGCVYQTGRGTTVPGRGVRGGTVPDARSTGKPEKSVSMG